jgi:protein TonB
MFDLITGKVQHAPRHQAVSFLVSIAAQTTLAAAVIGATLLVVTTPVPREAMMMAFVAAPPPPPPPPPPPKAPEPAQTASKPEPTAGTAAPVEPPREIAPEAPPTDFDDEGMADLEGVPGGVVGGVAGGLEPLMPPPPPPPPPPAPRGPIRVGGQIKEPALIYRVEPVYPGVAVSANLQGTVILEAIVDEEGRVESVKVLRSLNILDRPAIDAVKQWRYSPVLLNGRPEKFILTVAITFRLEDGKQ